MLLALHLMVASGARIRLLAVGKSCAPSSRSVGVHSRHGMHLLQHVPFEKHRSSSMAALAWGCGANLPNRNWHQRLCQPETVLRLSCCMPASRSRCTSEAASHQAFKVNEVMKYFCVLETEFFCFSGGHVPTPSPSATNNNSRDRCCKCGAHALQTASLACVQHTRFSCIRGCTASGASRSYAQRHVRKATGRP
jgi:hypothetical protein